MLVSLSFGQSKRGLAYGYHSAKDLEVLSPEISWWYNWSEAPESAVADVYTNYGFEFVPMTWNGNFNATKLRNFLSKHPETKYLLAFNEPNFIDQANMTPSEVAAKWSVLEAIADEYNLKIVGPAVNYCGNCVEENGTTYTDPFKYLDDFFAACTGCRVDYIAVHSYINTVSALKWYIDKFRKYNKPIWLTEFAGWEPNGNINNIDDQINFMIGAVDFLDTDPDVFRYSWFIGRGSGISKYPYIDILGADGTLTALGEVYKQMPLHDENKIVDIPATIEAEAYNKMSGILLEKTADASGFANVGYIEAGDWLEYKIRVPVGDNYSVRFRIAATKSASMNVLIDGTRVLTQAFSNTGGWQNWSTFENSMDLTEGVHTIRFQAVTNGFNINWFQIGNTLAVGDMLDDENDRIHIFPNPTSHMLNIKINDFSECQVRISDLMGKTMIDRSINKSGGIDISGLEKGFYTVIVTNNEFVSVKKIIIQ